MKVVEKTRRQKRRRIQLLLVHDHPITMEALKLYIAGRTDFEVTGLKPAELKIARKLLGAPPDVIIVNLRMTNLDGPTATRCLLRVFPGSKVIGFNGHEDRTSVVAMLRAGACGYLVNTCTANELFEAVETVSRGAAFFSPPISKIIQSENVENAPEWSSAFASKLTSNERTILAKIADGFSNKEMATDLEMSVRTIEKYRAVLMSKVQIKTVAGLTKFAIRQGMSKL